MTTLNATSFSSDIANILMLAGSGPVPLTWSSRPNKSGKEILERNESDTDLLVCESVADESHSAAVRALLYLWIGWPAEASMYAQAAHDPERVYIEAIRTRQAGDIDVSKELFSEMGMHPVFEPLAGYAIQTIGSNSDRSLDRFKNIVKLGEMWEAHAYADLFEQARLGKLNHPVELIVRSLQRREFELLFVRCYEGAIGESIDAFEAPQSDSARPIKRAPAKRPTKRPTKPVPSAKPKTDAAPTAKKRLGPLQHDGPRVGAHCPTCMKVTILPESRRGTKHECEQCQTVFLIPNKAQPSVSS